MSTLHHIDTPAKFKAWCDARKNTTIRDIGYATMHNVVESSGRMRERSYDTDEGIRVALIGLDTAKSSIFYGWRYTDSSGWQYTAPPSNIDVWVAY